jgi:hypothetical protein
MRASIHSIRVDIDTLSPTLIITLNLEYPYGVEAPLSILGIMRTYDNKKVGTLHEVGLDHNHINQIQLSPIYAEDRGRAYSKQNETKYQAMLSATLSRQAVDHIESQREKHHQKSVSLAFDFIVKFLEAKENEQFPQVRVQKFNESYKISQSDWIQGYAEHLGIGNFLLLELRIPGKATVSEEWRELLDRQYRHLENIENEIRQGNWLSVMTIARQFFDNFHFIDRKTHHAQYIDSLQQLFANDGHSADAFEQLKIGVDSFFNFLSKYLHDQDKNGKLQAIPVASKEEAYLAYSLSISLTNLIAKKLLK